LTASTLELSRLVKRATDGDDRAWERLVSQYEKLIWSLTRQFRLGDSDAEDVAQTAWLRLIENIDRIERPDRIGSWLATTVRRECLRRLEAGKRAVFVDDEGAFDAVISYLPGADERVLTEDRAREVRDALARLPRRWRRMLDLLMADPPVSYAEISTELGLPVGSIGPTRGRCLNRLRDLLEAS
jgi:RNA polymerase sigma factor (sigma-70 family)